MRRDIIGGLRGSGEVVMVQFGTKKKNYLKKMAKFLEVSVSKEELKVAVPAVPSAAPVAVKERVKGSPAKLRKSLVPGTVLILLGGRFRGKRVVFLRQLPSGLLLVTGPHEVNGVPLRRVNQAYVIATSTKIEVGDAGKDISDEFFKKPKSQKSRDEKGAFFVPEEAKKKVLTPERKATQKKVDEQILKAIKTVPYLQNYLKAKFSLKNGQYPHAMAF